MNKSAPENLLFLLFENYLVKSFHCHILESNRKETYVLDDYWSVSLPLQWRKDKDNLEELVNLYVNDAIKHFSLTKQDLYVHIISDNVDILDIKGNWEASMVTQKDFSLVPYFTSSYLGSFSSNYIYMDHYSALWFDNHGAEKGIEWDDWKDIAKIIAENFRGNETDDEINKWLNQILRPTIGKFSFYLPSIAFIMQKEVGGTIESAEDIPTVVAGGEMFSWMDSRDVLFPFLSLNTAPSVYRLYHDRYNVLYMNKAVKKHSLKLLERLSAFSLKHTGDIFTIKTKKTRKSGEVMGKVTLHDDYGFKTLYPVSEDLMVVPVNGIGTITFELEYPFYMDTQATKFQCRDFVLIDGRTHGRDNILNMRSWYDRIEKK